MMLYWPISLFLRNPHLTLQSKQELMSVGTVGAVVSEATMVACHQIAERSLHNGTSLVLVCNEGAPLRRAYLARPSDEDWQALERGGFVSDGIDFGFTLDALH